MEILYCPTKGIFLPEGKALAVVTGNCAAHKGFALIFDKHLCWNSFALNKLQKSAVFFPRSSAGLNQRD
jgi:hypothetical protein